MNRPVGKPMFVVRLTDQDQRPKVSIRAWAPRRAKNGWKSAVQVVGIGDDAVFEAYAPSPFECQLFAMRMIRQRLAESEGRYSFGGEPFETLFPMYAPNEFGPEVQKEAEAAISEITDREIKRMHSELGRKYPNYPIKVD